jgi:hypothetical protein
VIDILIVLLKPLLWFLYNPLKYFYLAPLALIGAIADVLMNNITVPIALGGGWLQEWTFSQRLERLCLTLGPDQELYWELAKKINRVCPTGDHIKAVL